MADPAHSAAAHFSASAFDRPNNSEPRVRLSIGQVLEQLQPEFPSLTISKLRFLEDQGLVTPRRTPSGYRQFSREDVERLRFVLECQRDRFWPLKVIRERLEELDAQAAQPTGPRPVTAQAPGRLTAEELAQRASVDVELIDQIADLGLIKRGPSQRFDPVAVDIVRAVTQLFELGIDARHLRAFRAAADRESGLVSQVVAPLRGAKTTAGIAAAQDRAAEVTNACLSLHAALLQDAVSRLER
ncbi:MAG TPA: MerR family transcriptional regulator [Actinomycetales bacterium]|nr:MerR family transcriptional regulator [Actinomycetales bacterium]